MVKHQTSIDTVAIQLDFFSSVEQRNKFNLIYNWIIGRRLGNLGLNKKKANDRIKSYELTSGGSKLATLHTGYTRKKDNVSGEYKELFYIRIRWCGLKSFKSKHDDASFSALMTICAYLNTTNTFYRFVELDIALDLFCHFNRVLATCIKPVNNVPYNPVGFVQYFEGVPTSYIEDYRDKEKRKVAIKRFYLYDKSSKEKLDKLIVSRVELKLQNRFFLRYGFNIESISNALSKYAIFYINNQLFKQLEINQMNNKRSLDYFELSMLEYKHNRISHNLGVIEEFVRQVKSVYVDFVGDVKVPSKIDDEFEFFFKEYI